MGTQTERLLCLPDVEAIFETFVRNANAAAPRDEDPRHEDIEAFRCGEPGRERLGLEEGRGNQTQARLGLSDLGPMERTTLDPVHHVHRSAEPAAAFDAEALAAVVREVCLGLGGAFGDDLTGEGFEVSLSELEEGLSEVVPACDSDRLRRESATVVPDVASVRAAPEPPREGSEDGQMPARELERAMDDMAVLLRYGRSGEVGERLEDLLRRYPRDLLLLRRIAEFHVESGSRALATACLFKLSSALFRRRNLYGMRAALQQVLILDPDNARALKLVGLLDARESERAVS